MKQKRSISRRQFLKVGASIIVGDLLGKFSEKSYADYSTLTKSISENVVETSHKGWEELPIDILSGAYLISDPTSSNFGAAYEDANYLLTQYIQVYPNAELLLSNTNGSNGKSGWVGYGKDLHPNAVIQVSVRNGKREEETFVQIPEGVYYIRGSSEKKNGNLHAYVKNTALYAITSDVRMPDVSSYTEITELALKQNQRLDESGNFGNDMLDCPSIGDVFITPIGTEIVIIFNDANIAPYIHSGDNFNSMSKKNAFSRHYGFGYSWYYCKTPNVCCFLGAYYESAKGGIKQLTLEELQKAEPRLYIRFQSKVTNTFSAAKIRTVKTEKNYQRLFTVVHITDTHGDIDSTFSAYEYADQIDADFVALTGDYVPYRPYHGYSILHTIIKRAKTPTVYSMGNHDVAGFSDEEVYSINIKPIKDTLCASEEHAYYYKDFQHDGSIVRVISLYPFYDKARVRDRGYYTQDQLMWLCNAMAEVPDGGHIFILRHFYHYRPIYQYENEAAFYDFSDRNQTGVPWLNMGSDPITDIVDAYNTRMPLFYQYSGELKNATETISVKYDFSERPNSEFVAYFTGHTHLDCVGYARDTKTSQVVLSSLCTTGYKGTEFYYGYTEAASHRDYGTDSQIAFNVFTFDFEKKIIRVARVGNGLFGD